jgi:hypothetical protein
MGGSTPPVQGLGNAKQIFGVGPAHDGDDFVGEQMRKQFTLNLGCSAQHCGFPTTQNWWKLVINVYDCAGTSSRATPRR